MYPAGVLIDTHGLNATETQVLGNALRVHTSLSLGRLEDIGLALGVILSLPLALEEPKILILKDLLKKMEAVLWADRVPWHPYHEACGIPGLISFNLEQRLRRNEAEVEKSANRLRVRCKH